MATKRRRSGPEASRGADRRRRAPAPAASSARDGAAALTQAIEGVTVGLVRVVTSTLVAALAGVQEVGREVGATGVGAVRGGIRAASDIGADLGHVATSAIRGTVEAAGELGGGAGSAARGTAGAVADVGADLGRIARRAVDGTRSAADRIGTAASRTVRSTMATTAQGVRGLLPSSPARRPTARTEGRGRGRRGAPAKSKRASKEPRSA
jgi:hypothetical protein